MNRKALPQPFVARYFADVVDVRDRRSSERAGIVRALAAQESDRS